MNIKRCIYGCSFEMTMYVFKGKEMKMEIGEECLLMEVPQDLAESIGL